MSPAINKFLRAVRHRIRAAWLLATAEHHLPFVIGGYAAAVLVWRVTDNGDVLLLAAAATALWAMGLLVRAAMMRISDWDAARAAERGLGARDALTTSLEFTEPNDELHREIQRRAAAVASTSRPGAAIRLAPAHDRLRLAGGLVAVTFLLAVMPAFWTGGNGVPGAAEEAERLEAAADVIDESNVDNAEELAEELRQAAEELRTAPSLDDALAALERSEQRLLNDLADDHLRSKAAVQGLARDLALRPLDVGAPLDAASQFNALAGALAGLSEAEAAALTQRLADLAASQSGANPELAEALASAASAIGAGNMSPASDALRSAAAASARAVSDVRGQQAIDEVLRALDGAAARLGGGDPAAVAGGGAGQTPGQGPGLGSGAGAGQGSGAGQGQGGGGQGGTAGGSAAGTISGVRGGEGGAAGQGGAGAVGSGAGELGEGRDVRTGTVLEPTDIGGVSERLQVGLEGGAGEGNVVGMADAPTLQGDAIVPYADVLPDYLVDAAAALDQIELTPSLRSVVRTYFDLLADQAG